ncbi:MAG TPA: exopolyphosphatase, partial [Euzebya sp.]|nr:exopolyphosphatase [Euzebya sp.]
EVVAAYADVWRSMDVTAVRITATSAARDSTNAADFARAIREVAGVMPEVLSGTDEAAIAFRGAVSGLPEVALPAVVLDIGGGSTELIVGHDQAERSTSRQLGSVRLTERILTSDPATAAQITRARAVVTEHLDAAEALVDLAAGATLIGVAGTATTVAALHLGLQEYRAGAIHGITMPASAVSALADRLLGLSAADIAALGPVEDGREDVLAAGALIMAMVIQRFSFAHITISEADILDGLALSLLDGGP